MRNMLPVSASSSPSVPNGSVWSSPQVSGHNGNARGNAYGAHVAAGDGLEIKKTIESDVAIS
jgi:hypothetical protein